MVDVPISNFLAASIYQKKLAENTLCFAPMLLTLETQKSAKENK